jgi:mercuric reductase
VIFNRRSSEARFDLFILGGGSAAFAAALTAAELGARVGLVEARVLGGTCVNRGCVPSKNLLHAAQLYWNYRCPEFPGLPRGAEPADFRSVIAQKRDLVAAMQKAKYVDVLAAYPSIQLFRGRARFASPDQVIIQADHTEHVVTARNFLIATGASPRTLPVEGLNQIRPLDYESVMELEELPESVLVIGAGPVGLELGQVLHRFGARVTVLEMMPRILPGEEPEISDTLADCLSREGIEIHTGARLRRMWRENGCAAAEAETPHGVLRLQARHVLLAAGVDANTRDLGLEAAGVVADSRGFVAVNEQMRTSAPHIWAAGDCTGGPLLVTVAAEQGRIAAENALTRKGAKFDSRFIPHAVFTSPEVASVGLGEAEARRQGLRVTTKRVSFDHVPKAAAVRDTRGLLKLVVDDRYRIVGVHLVSPQAADLIHIGVLAVRQRLTIADLLETTFVYPTLAEVFKIAAIAFRKDVTKLSCCAQ